MDLQDLRGTMIRSLTDDDARTSLPEFVRNEVPKEVPKDSYVAILIDHFALAIDRELYRRRHGAGSSPSVGNGRKP